MFPVGATLPSHCYSAVSRDSYENVLACSRKILHLICESVAEKHHIHMFFLENQTWRTKINEPTWLLLEGSCKFLTLKSLRLKSHILRFSSTGVHKEEFSNHFLPTSTYHMVNMKEKKTYKKYFFKYDARYIISLFYTANVLIPFGDWKEIKQKYNAYDALNGQNET